MTILEAINTAITNLDGVRLPVRDGENARRVQVAISILEALRETVEKQTEATPEDTEKGTDEE